MQEILNELLKGSTVILETEKLDEFLYYCSTQKDLYAFICEYSETTVLITIAPETNIRS
jgi:hypothetical protein